MENKATTKHYFYNLIFSPVLMIAIVCLFLLLPLGEIISPQKLDDVWNIPLEDYEGCFVEVTLEDLHYTGYNTKNVQNAEYGYYYMQQDEKCIFFAIPLHDSFSETIDKYTLKGKVIATDNYGPYNQLINSVALDLGWNSNDLSEISMNYMISGISYTPVIYCISAVILSISFIILLFFFVRQIVQIIANKKSSEDI